MEQLKRIIKDRQGFSLVELIVVIAIMVILMSLLVPNVVGYIEKSNNLADVQNAKVISEAIMLDIAQNGNSKDYGENIWSGDQNRHKGYIYVDDNEVRTSSKTVAEILEEAGIVGQGSFTYKNRSGVEPCYVSETAKSVCKSRSTWGRYQVNFIGSGCYVEFTYTACLKDEDSPDVDASEKFAQMIGGKPNSTVNLGGWS